MSKIRVDLGERSYDIVAGKNALKSLAPFLSKIGFSKLFIITDTTVGALYGVKVRNALHRHKPFVIEIPAGEKFKTLYTVSAIYDQMVLAKAGRDSAVIALGGGVIGDIAGFTAATYMRGLPVIQVPTTLLAMVDASIGGKTGVDHPQGKNLVGAFYQPKLVVADTGFLKTLPPREIKTGLAEVVKYGIIRDKKIFEALEKNPKADEKFWSGIITSCAAIKADVVSKDERETSGLRMILNFGHTFGHAIESVTKYSRYTHGEAVAIGMAAASNLAYETGLFELKDLERVIALLSNLKLPTRCDLRMDEVMKALSMDKKAKKGKARFVLPVKIGKVVVKENASERLVRKALKEAGCR